MFTPARCKVDNQETWARQDYCPEKTKRGLNKAAMQRSKLSTVRTDYVSECIVTERIVTGCVPTPRTTNMFNQGPDSVLR